MPSANYARPSSQPSLVIPRRAHPLEHSRIQPTTSVAATPHKQQTTMERYSASVPYDKETKRYKDITEAVAYHIAKDMLPFSTVEKSGYKKLIHVLDPRYVLPGRKYFSKTAIPKLYVMCKECAPPQKEFLVLGVILLHAPGQLLTQRRSTSWCS